MKAKMKRILVIRLDFIGDMLCTTALLSALKQKWPLAEIHVLANKYNKEVLKNNPDVSQVHTYVYSKQCERNMRSGRINALFDRFKLLRCLRNLSFDLLLIPNGGVHKNSIQFARAINVKDKRWHTAATEFDDRNPQHIATRPVKHEALSGFALMPELGIVEADKLALKLYPDLHRQANWRAELGDKEKMRIGLFVSNKSDHRRWPVHNWFQLVESLNYQFQIYVFKDPNDHSITEAQCEVFRQLGCKIITPHSIADLVAISSLLDLVVSADSAPIHISSALHLPVVALFEARPEKYLRWYPLNTLHVILHSGAFVRDIPVEAVHEAICSLTGKK